MRSVGLGLLLAGLLAGCKGAADGSQVQPGPAGSAAAVDGLNLPPTAHLTYRNLPPAVRDTPREKDAPKFGPPPPGYVRILGGTVPGWTPADAHRPVPRGSAWVPLGPRPITSEYWSGEANASGRVVSVAPHPTDPDTVYVASASGGVWKTTDGGGTWVPLTDELPCLNHGAVAVDPTNPDVLFVGTGEYTTESVGDGVFRSTDGGRSWARVAPASLVGSTCSRIVVDPTNPQRVHLTGAAGYFRSLDGGTTWGKRLAGPCSDLALHPLHTNYVWVARHGDGVYRSMDWGSSFFKFSSGLATTDVRRILLAAAPSAPGVLYAVIVNGNSGLRGLYRTDNLGDTWTLKPNTPNFPYPQGWYDVFLGVDPADADTVYAGGVFPSYAVAGVIKSLDGGDSWTDITVSPVAGQLHPDQHAIAWGPDGTIWIGNDGGVWKSTDAGASWINTNATLTVTQNYQIALHPQDPAVLVGGTQDNGTVGRPAEVLEWPQVMAGDGGFAAFDFADPGRLYTTYVYLTVYRIDANGWKNISGPWSGDARNFIAPLVMDPNDPHTLLGGTNRVWRTTTAATTAEWTPISPTTVAAGGTLNAIAVAPGDSNVIYTGSSTGRVYVTTNAATWSNRSSGLPLGEISDLEVDPADPGVAYVCYYNTRDARVLRTGNYGVQWASVTGTLPTGVSATALAVDWRWDPPHLYVGSGAGVYESRDHGATWTKDGPDLPNVNIGDLRIDFARGTITAGTYGRGAWRKLLPLPGQPGDLNCDGFVDWDDIDAFVIALKGREAYETLVPGCDWLLGDVDGNGQVDFDDIDPFVALLGS